MTQTADSEPDHLKFHPGVTFIKLRHTGLMDPGERPRTILSISSVQTGTEPNPDDLIS
jgi:hypothetical protein